MSEAAFKRCRSPMEEQLLGALIGSGWHELPSTPGAFSKMINDNVVRFTVNEPLVVAGLSYVLDFSFRLFDRADEKWSCIVDAEVDGHDFHDRTKEQARRDRARDRALALHKITVVRFTGAEVYADAYACVEEIDEIVVSEVTRRCHHAALLDPKHDARAYHAVSALRTLVADAHMEVQCLRDGLPGSDEYTDERDWFERQRIAERLLADASIMVGKLVR